MNIDTVTIQQVCLLCKETLEDLREVSKSCPPALRQGISRGEIEEEIFIFRWRAEDYGIFDVDNCLDTRVSKEQRLLVLESLAELHFALDKSLGLLEYESHEITDETIASLREHWQRISQGLNLEVLDTLPRELKVRSTLRQQIRNYDGCLDALDEGDLTRASSSE